MFKAKLVDPNKYVIFKRKQFFVILSIGLLTGLTANALLDYILLYVLCLMFLFFAISIWFIIKKRSGSIVALPDNGTIEINDDVINILPKQKGESEIIDVSSADLIVVNNPAPENEDSIKRTLNIILGKAPTPYLIVQQNNHQRAFHFEMGSNYMYTKLNQIIDSWIKIGHSVKRG